MKPQQFLSKQTLAYYRHQNKFHYFCGFFCGEIGDYLAGEGKGVGDCGGVFAGGWGGERLFFEGVEGELDFCV